MSCRPIIRRLLRLCLFICGLSLFAGALQGCALLLQCPGSQQEICLDGECFCGDSCVSSQACEADAYCARYHDDARGGVCVPRVETNVPCEGLDPDCVDEACELPSGDPGTVCTDTCVDINLDAQNCGGCGLACADGTSCNAGECDCGSLTSCDGTCTDTTGDVQNCGGCGIACPEGADCVSGTCKCPTDTTICNGSCRDLANDPQACGSCDNQCAPGAECRGGACACPGIQELCDGVCTDILTSAEHCSVCNRSCPTGVTCTGGTCDCPSGTVACGDECIVPDTEENCGRCANQCATGEVCDSGQCVGQPCNSSADCAGTQTCTGVGSDPADPPFCRDSNPGAKSLGEECVNNVECASRFCNQISLECSEFCLTNSNCASGQQCLPLRFSGDRFIKTCIRSCSYTPDCFSDRVCRPINDDLNDTIEFVCQVPVGPGGVGDPCSVDQDCRSGLCVTKTTRTTNSCMGDSGCAAGETCLCPVSDPNCATGKTCAVVTSACTAMCVGGAPVDVCAGSANSTCSVAIPIRLPSGMGVATTVVCSI